MKNERDAMREVLRRYGLDRPVPPEVRRHFSGSMRGTFMDIMKETGQYTVLFGLLSYFYFLARKFVAAISTKAVISLLLAATLAAGGVAVYFYFTGSPERAEETSIAEDTGPKAGTGDRETARGETVYTLVVEPIQSGSVEKEMLDRVNAALSRELVKGGGATFATFTPRGKGTPYTLSGFIERLDESMVLSVKVVDNRSSAIALVAREKIVHSDKIEEACGNLAARIINSVK